jgi:UMF1 family MFS transporter
MSNKKERTAWYLYDWANSAYTVIIITLFFGPFLTMITKDKADVNGNIPFLGFNVYYASLFAYLSSIAVMLQIVLLPLIGSIADITGNKKKMFNLFAIMGSMATIMMFYIKDDYYIASFLFLFTNICFSIANVLYNAFLNDISLESEREQISSIGWGIGYLGGGLALLIVLILFNYRFEIGLDDDLAIRLSMSFAGLWWAFFSIIPIKNLKGIEKDKKYGSKFKDYFLNIFNNFKSLSKFPNTLIFLIAYLFYNDGVQSVITLSGQFGKDELHLSMEILTKVILLVQVVAFFGSILFNYISKKINSKNTLLLSLVIWILALIYVYLFVYSEFDFYLMAIAVALVMGGTQSISRAVYSRNIPKGSEAEFFSIYELSEKGTSWIGPLAFAITMDFTHSYRLAILSLVIFFVIGFLLLLKYQDKKTELAN